MVFLVIVYGCESWTIKKAEHQRIDTFELWCWRRLWESLGQQGDQPNNPKGNQSWIFIGRTDAEAEALILWPQTYSILVEETLMLGKIEGRKRREWQRMKMAGWHHGLNGYVGANSRRWWRIGKPGILQSMRKQRAGHDWATKQRQQKITFYTLLPQVPFFALQKKLEFKPREDGSLGHESTIFLIWSLSE